MLAPLLLSCSSNAASSLLDHTYDLNYLAPLCVVEEDVQGFHRRIRLHAKPVDIIGQASFSQVRLSLCHGRFSPITPTRSLGNQTKV